MTFFLIDGFSLLFRSYYGYPPNLTTPQGVPINAVYGFVTLMLNAIKQFERLILEFVWIEKNQPIVIRCFLIIKPIGQILMRSFLVQLPEFKKVIASFDIPMLEMPGFESDDLLGTLSHQFSKDGIKTYIMSGDMDLLQLVDKNTSIVMNKKGVSNYVIYTEELLKE